MAIFKNRKFQLKTPFEPMGDQPEAIDALTRGLEEGRKSQVLLGVTGSGKTFTMANVIARINRPTLVLCHNKTLAAQLFSEFREFFPENAVEYFVSYYDYYQPEAYIPSTDTYIEKDSAINDEIDKLRHSATRSLLERNDVLIVSSISCIYGLGSPESYEGMLLALEVGREIKRQDMLRKLIEIQYKRNDVDFHRGTFRVRGDVVEIFPAYEEERAIRVEFFGDEIESISEVDPLRGIRLSKLPRVTIYPGSHYVTTQENRKRAIESIRAELRVELPRLKEMNRLVEAQRLEQRTMFDLEMIEELGFCQGIENYSRHLTGRDPGAAPPTLIEYFGKDWLLVVDESHVTVPQIGGMSRGDRARKLNLVEHGFRLPSALDNRPLTFEEWEGTLNQTLYVSATPGEYELNKAGGEVVEQVIRPTGLVDPVVEVRPATSQVDNLLTEIRRVVAKGDRVLVTVLTKKLAEDLTRFYQQQGVRVKYLHSDIETLERIEILRDLRLGTFDVLVGINLLREGLDLPEVSMVAILDADKEGFLRSERSLIQTIGRAARNLNGRAILYADRVTRSMQQAMDETQRRREKQVASNLANGIIPRGIVKAVTDVMEGARSDADGGRGAPQGKAGARRGASNRPGAKVAPERAGEGATALRPEQIVRRIKQLEGEMFRKARNLEFEEAGRIRDQIETLKRTELGLPTQKAG